MAVSLTPAAAKHVTRYLAKRGKGVGVRLGVKTTGCSGLAYKLEYVDDIAPEDALFESAWTRLEEVIGHGTGAIEIKSGYGLSLESELKMLRVIRRLKEQSPIPVKATFLGAHAVPLEYKDRREAYIDLIVN